MPKAYVILTEANEDQEGMDAYGRAAAPAVLTSWPLIHSRRSSRANGTVTGR